MWKILAITLISAFSLKSFADVPEDLRGQAKQNKLVIHSCDSEELDRGSCRVISDINLSDVISSLKSGNLFIFSQETVEVKKGISADFGIKEEPYWETCDAEDGDCIEWSVGSFTNFISNHYSITRLQRDAILNKILENSLKQNTHVYFFNKNTNAGERLDDGIITFFNLTKTQLLVK